MEIIPQIKQPVNRRKRRFFHTRTEVKTMPRSPEPTSKPPPAADEEIAAMLETLGTTASGLIDD
jgi:hypothetical protein